MEYGPENNIFFLKMMMKSGLEFFFEIPPCAKPFWLKEDLLLRQEDVCSKLQIQ